MKWLPSLVSSLVLSVVSCLPAVVMHAAVLAGGIGTLQAATLVDRATKDETVSVAADDPAMRKAFETARATLDDFLAKLKSPPAGAAAFAAKVGVRAGADIEYLWIGNLSIEGERLSGRIDNAPRTVKTVKAGDTFTFAKGEIVDWLYIDRPRRRMHGNFTACALMSREPPKEAAALRKQLGLACKG